MVEISVIMSVYNTKEIYLRAAIDSILNQTFREFEFIIVNDGSNQKTADVLNSYTDKRICIIHNKGNIGLTKSLNKALVKAAGKYIARIDADDIADERRLQEQYAYMEKHSEIDIAGTWVKSGKKIDKCGGTISTEWRWVRMLFGNHGIVHSSAFIRREFLARNHLKYDETMNKSQDYKLWVDCMKHGARMGICPKVLVYYRTHDGQISSTGEGEQLSCARKIRTGLIREVYPEIKYNELEQFLDNHTKILSRQELENLIKKIEENNLGKKIYNVRVLHNELVYYFKDIIAKSYLCNMDYILYRIRRSLCKHGI